MTTAEFDKVMARLDQLERLLSRLVGEAPAPTSPAEAPAPPQAVTPDMSEQERVKARQEEGHYILATQGVKAYKKFWQDQAKKDRKPRLRRAA